MALSTEQNYNMINGPMNTVPALLVRRSEKELDKVLDAWELESIQRRCTNNNQVAIHVVELPRREQGTATGLCWPL